MSTSNPSACPSNDFPSAQKLPKTNTFPELSRQAVGTVLLPVCPSTSNNIYLCLQAAAIWYQKRRAWQCLVGKSFLMWGASVCCNPLQPAVNLWATGTVGQFVLSVHWVKHALVVSSVSLSLWTEMSLSSVECAFYGCDKLIWFCGGR
jgi:hypothetical protein